MENHKLRQKLSSIIKLRQRLIIRKKKLAIQNLYMKHPKKQKSIVNFSLFLSKEFQKEVMNLKKTIPKKSTKQ